MKKYILDLKVVSVEPLSDKHVLIKLTDDKALPEILPGQFVEVRVDHSPATMLRRPISINFVDREQNQLWLLVAVVGDGTRQLSKLQQGDVLNCMLPLGNGFTMPTAPGQRYLLVGGGVGVAPLLYFGKLLKDQGADPVFLLGARTATDLLELDEFAKYGRVCITTEDGRRVAVSANPLNDCTSLDAPLDGEDKGSSTKGETIEDPAATQAFQTAEDDLYTEELHNALEDAMTKILTDQEAHVLRRRYYDSQTLRAIGEELGVHCERIRQIERKACRKLSGLSSIQRWHDDVITTRAWRGTGWNAWSRYGSVQERTAEYLEEKEEEERFNYYAWRDQMIREHYADLEAAGYFDRHPEWRASLEPRTDSKESTPPGGEV